MESPKLKDSGESQASGSVTLPRIAGYTILEKLSDRSGTAIYKARQDRLGRIVALKLLPELPPPCDVMLERFNRATYVAAQLVHPNLPVLYETGTSDGYYFAALEYVQGRTLQEILTDHFKLSERRTVWIGMQIARVLAAMHDKGIVHRNLKPQNILVDSEGKVRLIGLGLAKCDAACFSKHLDAQTIGTPHYMAPEMIRGNCTDPRSDLYSLGVTLYTMVSGHPPFAKGVPAAVMAKHLYERARPLQDYAPELSTDFMTLVEEMMAKNLNERLGSAHEGARRLERLQALQEQGRIRPHLPAPPRAKEPQAPLLEIGGAARVGRVGPLSGTLVVFLASLLSVFLVGMCAFCAAWWLMSDRNVPAKPGAADPVKRSDKSNDAGAAQANTLNMPGISIAPALNRASRSAAEANAEYLRLKELQEVFMRDPGRGIREWESFQRHYPQAAEMARSDAMLQIKNFERLEAERKNSQRRLPRTERDGEQMDF